MEVKACCLYATTRGVVKPDKDGYYELTVGQAGVPNAAGLVYSLPVLEAALAEPNFQRMEAKKAIYGELAIGPRYGDMNAMFDKTHIRAANIIMYTVAYNLNKETGLLTAKIKPVGAQHQKLRTALDQGVGGVKMQLRAVINSREGNEIKNMTLVTFDVDVVG